jgi:hypothetical protein
MTWTTTRRSELMVMFVGEILGDDDEDELAKETARTRTVCCDARRVAPCAAQATVPSG